MKPAMNFSNRLTTSPRRYAALPRASLMGVNARASAGRALSSASRVAGPPSSRASTSRARAGVGPTPPYARRTRRSLPAASASIAKAAATMLMSRSRRLETLCHSTRRPSGVAAPPRGRRTAPRISPGASAVLRYPVKKASSGSSRAPRSERSSTRASSARSSGALSPMGEAVTRLPASVARLRICREAKTWSISSKAGCSPASASSTAVSVAAPPMRHSPPTTATARSSATPSVEMSRG